MEPISRNMATTLRPMTPQLTNLHSASGQASIEALGSAMALMLITTLLLAFFYFCILATCLQFSSHELLVCRESVRAVKDFYLCENQFRKQLSSYLRFGHNDLLLIQTEPSAQSMTLKMSFPILHFTTVHWTYKDRVNLPLK